MSRESSRCPLVRWRACASRAASSLYGSADHSGFGRPTSLHSRAPLESHKVQDLRGDIAEADVSLVMPSAALQILADRLEPILRERLAARSAQSEAKYLTVGETAEYLRCSKQRVYDLVSSRRLIKQKD